MGRKKSSMQEEVENTEAEIEVGEQMPLIDIGPENEKEISKHLKLYRAAQKQRLKALDKEVSEKQKILELVRKEDLQRLADGKISFHCGGMLITITPRDEVIKIKEDNQSTESE